MLLVLLVLPHLERTIVRKRPLQPEVLIVVGYPLGGGVGVYVMTQYQ